MNKQILHIILALIVSVAICNASPARLERLRPSKFSARQEVSQDISEQTPYPPTGFQPEVRFDLPTDEKLTAPDITYLPPIGDPAKTYGPPAENYGPPDISVKDEVEGLVNNGAPALPQDHSEAAQPDETQPGDLKPKVQPTTKSEEEVSVQQSKEDRQANEYEEAETEAEIIETEINRIEAEEGLIDPLLEHDVLAKSKTSKADKLRSAKLQDASFLRPVYIVNYNGQLYRLLN